MNIPKLNGYPLRLTLLAGLILFILTGFILTIFWFTERTGSRAMRQQDSFFLLLREYDASAEIITGTDRELALLNRELDRIEKRAISVESWLSVLKRRRALAELHYPSEGTYRNSINRALKAFPSSQPLTALAAAALVKNTAINNQAEKKLREMLNALTEQEANLPNLRFDVSSFDMLRLSLHILLGDFSGPKTASSWMTASMTAQMGEGLSSDGNEDLIMDLAILNILRANYRDAAYKIQTRLNSPLPVSGNFIRFAGEYYYDFGDIRRSAELFSRLDDEQALIRQADALYLAGYTGSARSIWLILAGTDAAGMDADGTDAAGTDAAGTLNENSLYNLAVTEEDQIQSVSFLEKLANAESLSVKNSRQFGLIRYSRLFGHREAAAILGKPQNITPNFPYVDLEICRRSSHWQEPGRQVAEAWLLLDRNYDIENLYWWAAWKIFQQRYHDEAQILFNHAQRLMFTGEWVSVYKAIHLMYEGELGMAEKILHSIPSDTAEWHINANLGRIYESQRYPIRAIEQYELAALKVQNPKTASIIKSRIARCFFALGRVSEAYSALEHSLELDPDNVNAKFEYDKMRN